MAWICPTCGNPRTDPSEIPEHDRGTGADSSECYHVRFGVAVPAIGVKEDKVPEGIAYLPEEWPHGLGCSACALQLSEGDRYSMRFSGLTDDGTPIAEVVCIGCNA